MTDEDKALMRKRYMKCYVELLLLPDEALREEFPHIIGPGLEKPNSDAPRLSSINSPPASQR